MEAKAATNFRPVFSLSQFSTCSQRITPQNISFLRVLERCSRKCLCRESKCSTKQNSERETCVSSKEEIIARFRQIRIAIDRTESGESSCDEENSFLDLSVLATKMRITEKGKEWIPKRKRFVRKRSVAITEAAELESVREPPSTKWPVPSPSALDNGESVVVEVEKPKLEVMKVTELKEVAKLRGVKGYYKLKKQELLKLLLVDSITEA